MSLSFASSCLPQMTARLWRGQLEAWRRPQDVLRLPPLVRLPINRVSASSNDYLDLGKASGAP